MALSRIPNSVRYFRPKPLSLAIGKELCRGAYGAVYSGRLDDKEVAVKRIHGLLLEAARDQGELDAMLGDFQQECELLERVNHPHVVGFKGAFYDDTTDEPILVMELMTQNLRQYLQRNRNQLSRQKQLEVCLEIVFGLYFLHTHTPPIVHRDLTDKNILLTSDGLVKIGDLGQSRLKVADYFSSAQPGAVPFMSPEALQLPSHYNEKLDIFSLGVLILEVATQQSPRVGLIGIGRDPELQRRREDFSKLDEDHPLRLVILACLKDDPKERPDIVTVRTQMLAMQEEVEILCPSVMEHCVQSSASTPTQLQTMCSPGTEPNCATSTGNCETQVVSTEAMDCEDFKTGEILKLQTRLHSLKMPDLPIATVGATAVVIAQNVYVCGGLCQDVVAASRVQMYDINKKSWTTLTPAPLYNCRAVAIDSQLVLIGGRLASSHAITNLLSTWTENGWQVTYPPMPTKRSRPGVTTFRNFVIVAGGRAEDNQTVLDHIDILDTTVKQWWTPANLRLPRPLYMITLTINTAHMYVASAFVSYDATTRIFATAKHVWQLPVAALEKVLTGDSDSISYQWMQTSPTPNYHSLLLQGTAHPLAVGGNTEPCKPSTDIAVYDPVSNRWSTVGQLLAPRIRCAAAVCLNNSSFIVFGGCRNASEPLSTLLSSVELIYVP